MRGKPFELFEIACRNYKTRLANTTVYSVRGPASISLLNEECQDKLKIWTPDGSYTNRIDEIQPHGDAGFLIPFLFPELGQQPSDQNEQNIEKKTCIIFHKYDEVR